ncbi:unnamed protein product [Ceutorhynchus assimilis]|uniref:Uncharacterized protein n=1 Tax=Ceutorhynchus assimilis TaxID=467358 RepID=A0A9P0DVM4_9CUCU|nr:unnamed protein product [Ceutorhynchus assimilis]
MCRAVVVDYQKTSKCYQELPVIYLNRSLDRTAITHILVEHGTKVECHCQPLLLVNFKLENNWLEVTSDLKRTTEALELDANDGEDKLSMPRISISPISSNGISSKEDMESFQQTLLYPNTRKAVTNQVARRIIALDSSDPYYMPNLFSTTEFTNIAQSAVGEVWRFLSRMGNLFSICGFLYTIVCALANQRRDCEEEDQKIELIQCQLMLLPPRNNQTVRCIQDCLKSYAKTRRKAKLAEDTSVWEQPPKMKKTPKKKEDNKKKAKQLKQPSAVKLNPCANLQKDEFSSDDSDAPLASDKKRRVSLVSANVIGEEEIETVSYQSKKKTATSSQPVTPLVTCSVTLSVTPSVTPSATPLATPTITTSSHRLTISPQSTKKTATSSQPVTPSVIPSVIPSLTPLATPTVTPISGRLIDSLSTMSSSPKNFGKSTDIGNTIPEYCVASLVKNTLGYVAKVAVVYLMKCVAVPVELRRETHNCYVELAVTAYNESYFMSPVTRIMQKHAEQTECSTLIPPLYYINIQWIEFAPTPPTGILPQEFEPEAEENFSFRSIKDLVSGGIYTYNEIKKAPEAMTFGLGRNALNNMIIRRVAGQAVQDQRYSTLNLFSKE